MKPQGGRAPPAARAPSLPFLQRLSSTAVDDLVKPVRHDTMLPDQFLMNIATRKHNASSLPHDAKWFVIDPKVGRGAVTSVARCALGRRSVTVWWDFMAHGVEMARKAPM
jgi:hypothetical protein